MTPYAMRLTTALVLAGAAAPVHAQSAIEWSPCRDQTAEGRVAECASIDMPLDHAEPDGSTVTIGIRRVLGSGGGSGDGAVHQSARLVRQLWYLAGGPGDAVGGALGRLAELLDDPTLDLYGIDHRGTGDSGKLECPVEEATDSPDGSEITDDEWPDCIAHLRATRTDLEYLTVTQAARDLGRAIERISAIERGAASGTGAASVFIFGASYGSFWANRYLELFPEQPTGVILDGIVPADWSFAEFDARLDAVGREWLARCGRDETCARHLGSDPAKTAADVLARLDDGHCPTLGLDGSTARLLLGVVLMVDEIPNGIIPVLIHRWDRCAWHDDMALLHFYRAIAGSVGEDASHSPALQRHVALSELWNATDPSAEDLEAALAATVMTTRVSSSFARTYPDWPRYAPDALDGHQAAFSGPMLMLQGGLDPTMDVARLGSLREHYAGDSQSFVVIPEAGHVVLNFSDCARSLYGQFLADPSRPLDAGCAGTESFVDFEVDAETSAAILGTTDLWGDSVSMLATLAWVGISFVCYVLAASTPLVLDYRGLTASAAAFAIAGIQVAAWVGVSRMARPARARGLR